MALRFVQPELVRLPLADGEWIEVKRELTAGEARRMFRRQTDGYKDDGFVKWNPETIKFAKVAEYLVGWSLSTPFSEAALDNLSQTSFKQILDAVETHEATQEREHLKNSTGGGSKSAAISPSVAS